jgi:integrase
MGTIRERKRKDGRVVYNVQVRRKGYPTQTQSFTDRRKAEKWATIKDADIIDGRAFKNVEAGRRTLSDAIKQYTLEKLHTLRSKNMHNAALPWWNKRLGHLKLANLDAAAIVKARTALLEEKFTRAKPDSDRTSLEDGATPNQFSRTPATANRYLAVLSKVLSHVRKAPHHWIAVNPCIGIEKLPETPNRARTLSPEQRKALLAQTVSDPILHLFTLTALHTVCRAGELLKLRWADVDVDLGQVTFRETKNGEPRSAWLHGDAAKLMAEHAKTPHEPTDFVFRNTSGRGERYQYDEKFSEACKAAGLGKFHFHNLRHTAATVLAKQGASEQQLKAIGGWRSGVVSKYVHLAATDTKEITEKLSKSL